MSIPPSDRPTTQSGSPNHLVRVDALRGADWDRAVSEFSDAVIDQTWAWAANCWGQRRVSTVHLEQDERIAAACLVVILRAPLLPGGIAHVKFGPLWRGGDDGETLRAILRAIDDEYVGRRGLYLRVVPRAAPGDDACADALLRLGFRRSEPEDPLRYLVDLQHDQERLRAGLKSKWRYHLKKSEAAGLSAGRVEDLDGVATFRKLYGEMRGRKDFADVRALTHLDGIAAALPAALRLQFWLCTAGDEAVAAAIVSHLGDSALYLFGASNERGRALRAGYYLHWAIATHLRHHGCRWYDLGGACHDEGLRQFKSGMAGRLGATPRLAGEFDRAPGPVSSLVARGVFRLRELVGSVQDRLPRSPGRA